MRVGLHADAAGHSIPGGIGAYVRCLVREALREPAGDDIQLLVSRSTNASRWPADAVDRSMLPLRMLYTAWNRLHVPRVTGYDVVHAPGLVIPPAPGARLVATINDDTIERYPEFVPPFWRRLYQRGFRTALEKAAVLCAISQATKRRLVGTNGVDPDRVVVTPLAALVLPGAPRDDSILDRCAIHRPFLLNVSTLEPRKNQAGLIRAFVRARLVEHTLVIAGASGWAADDVRAAAARAGGRVVLTGALTDGELAALYSAADAFAMPSVYEGFGMPLVEALAHGLPSVISLDDALVEIADDAALSVEASSEPDLALALIRVCTDADEREVLRAAGPRRASQYSWGRTFQLTREAWTRAVA